jgi:hypothetical protein
MNQIDSWEPKKAFRECNEPKKVMGIPIGHAVIKRAESHAPVFVQVSF